MKNLISTAAAVIALSAATFAHASPYVSLGGNYTRVENNAGTTSQKSPNAAVGYNFGAIGPLGTSIAVELDHTSMGKQSGVYTRATSLSGLVSYPVADKFSVYGRAGVANVQAGRTAELQNVLGVGAEYKITDDWAVTGEVKRYGPRLTTYVASVKYTF